MRHLALCVALALPSAAQAATNDPQPTAWTARVQPLESVQQVVMPPVDEAALKAEDERRFAETREKALRYAANLKVDLTPENAGTWERLDSGELLWRLRVYSNGARSLNFAFDQYLMPEGGRLFIYAADGKHVYRPFTAGDNEEHGELWTPPVFGPETVLELTIPESARAALKLHLALVNHDYRGFGQPNMEKSGACNIDIVCPISNPYNDQERANAVISTGGSTFCSGSLINNTANDARPFFMSADHCLSPGQAPSLVAFWNYFNSTCRPVNSPESGQPGDGSLSQFNTGSIFRAENAASDFHLVELDDAPLPAFNVFLAGWDRTANPTQFNATVAIHHPSTDEMRITFAPGMTESGGWPPSVPGDGSHIHALWGADLGVTEPGSSGSPLYTQQGRYIGQLHGGPSACGAGDLSDYYGRLSVSWTGGGTDSTRLSNWLDPGNTGVFTLNGINGCAAPAAPTGVSATATTPNTIQVTWGAVGGATGYNVYRSNGACPGTVFTLVGNNVSGTTFDDTTVSGGNTYAYVVRSIQVCESVNSTCDDAVATGTCTTPPTFAGLTSVTNAGTSSCALNLAWSAGTTGCVGSTLSYNVYRSLTPGFVPGPANLRQSCVVGTGFTDTTVTSGTPYYYVVRAEDSTSSGSGPCNSGNQETNTVERSGAAFGNTSATVTDNVESGGGYWSNSGGVGTNLWTIVTDFSNSPTHAWKVTDPATVSDQRLTTIAAGNIPASFVMSWFQRYDTEASTTPGVGFDGHVLEYSLNGSTWTDILAAQAPIPANPARFLMNGYNRTISGSFASPLANRLAWSGQQLPFQQVQVNLADFSGQNAFFRFRFASDNSVADVGVWIDDITFRAPGACGGAAFIRGDFNTDGKTDILWRHDTSGENVLWYMNGAVLAGGEFTTPAALTDTRWKMVGTHDFNADLKNDILWRHDTAGENVLWYMNGSVLTSGEFLTPAALADVDWKMAGTGDFNGDGKPDIAWRHQVVGEIVLWYMNGSVLTSGTFTTPSSFTPAYALVGVADFSNPLDGKPDFVWRNNTTGENLIWFMNGATMIGSATTTTLADTGWKLVATGDYNLDLKNDFVWRHDTSGENVIWFMNGATLVSGTFTTPASFPDTRWKMVGPR